mmetsp:Transcript_19153/g.62145  ORF Transcript_19153/g.62145 Transcript_19153/m.62145 type:complete len:347 (+) Transcript_19153:133-1173(+)
MEVATTPKPHSGSFTTGNLAKSASSIFDAHSSSPSTSRYSLTHSFPTSLARLAPGSCTASRARSTLSAAPGRERASSCRIRVRASASLSSSSLSASGLSTHCLSSATAVLNDSDSTGRLASADALARSARRSADRCSSIMVACSLAAFDAPSLSCVLPKWVDTSSASMRSSTASAAGCTCSARQPAMSASASAAGGFACRRNASTSSSSSRPSDLPLSSGGGLSASIASASALYRSAEEAALRSAPSRCSRARKTERSSSSTSSCTSLASLAHAIASSSSAAPTTSSSSSSPSSSAASAFFTGAGGASNASGSFVASFEPLSSATWPVSTSPALTHLGSSVVGLHT